MSNAERTTPSSATKAEESRDAQVSAGADTDDEAPDPTAPPADDVAEHYEEMTELGAEQRGEGRLP